MLVFAEERGMFVATPIFVVKIWGLFTILPVVRIQGRGTV